MPIVQNQSPKGRFEREEVSTSIEMSAFSQAREGDVVILNFSDKQSLSNSYGETQFKDNQAVQEISSVARAVSEYSQIIEGSLNEDELIAIKQIVAHVEPIVRKFLASDPEELNLGNSVGLLTGDQEMTQKAGVEPVYYTHMTPQRIYPV